ncbi:hypothetical protein K439DRAFT_1631132 [Ramaria rubella]|nr:hypothetical protein K439DRAFT_1631132 [Ramaria rubella]
MCTQHQYQIPYSPSLVPTPPTAPGPFLGKPASFRIGQITGSRTMGALFLCF